MSYNIGKVTSIGNWQYYHMSYISKDKGIVFVWQNNSKVQWIDIKITKRKHRFTLVKP